MNPALAMVLGGLGGCLVGNALWIVPFVIWKKWRER